MYIEEFRSCQEQYKNDPVIFFFDVKRHNDRNYFDGIPRSECIEKAFYAIPISEFDTDWNDTDDDGTYIPDPLKTWCHVSMP